MKCPCYPHLPAPIPTLAFTFPPQKVQFIVTFTENGFNGCFNILKKNKKPFQTSEMIKMNYVLGVFLSLHWLSQKGMFWISEFCLALATLRYKRGVREASCWPQLGSASQPLSCSGSLVGTSYCFHNTVTVSVPPRLPGTVHAQPQLRSENKPAQELLPEENSSAWRSLKPH